MVVVDIAIIVVCVKSNRTKIWFEKYSRIEDKLYKFNIPPPTKLCQTIEQAGKKEGLGGGAAPAVEAGSNEITIIATVEYEIL